MRGFLVVAAALALTDGAEAQNECRFYLANHSDSDYGITLELKSPANSNCVCTLSSVNLELSVGDGTNYHHVALSAPPLWHTGVVYTAQAIVTASGSQQLILIGQSTNSVQAVFQPAQQPFFGSLVSDSGASTEAYLVSQVSLLVTNGPNTLLLVPNNYIPIPLASLLMAGPAPWPATFVEDPSQTTTIIASFRFDLFPSDTNEFAPYIDDYGQVTFSFWPGKVSTTNDLAAALLEEQTWFTTNGPLNGMDAFGGSTLAGWTDHASSYYHKAFHNGRWWLISPMGNPLFYIGVTGVYDNVTPITGRESIFTNLPATPDFMAAYSTNAWGDTQTTAYVSFDIANQIRKYGSGWTVAEKTQAVQRVLSWGFGGVGKEGGLPNLPRSPILKHDGGTNLLPNGHPDIFDTNILRQLESVLTNQIGSDITNPYVIGWSVGNEKKEIIDGSEVQAILVMGALVPAKRALVDYGLAALYSNSVSGLALAWGVPGATNVQTLYAAKAVAPTNDVETLRQYYEQGYYSNLYHIVKGIDTNHLYFGSWILPRYTNDWPLSAANCDVLGFDDFSPGTLTSDLVALITNVNKPVIIGAFSFPSDYGGMRGVGWEQYTGATTYSDSASGDEYARRLQSASANPYFVGLEWFEYRDEPACGRGNDDGTSYPPGSLVVGENHAFGLVDVTDRPKYDLVNKVRAANLTALKSLGLLGPRIITTDADFGVMSNKFGFNIRGLSGQTIVVERSVDLIHWLAFQTNTLSSAPVYFGDSSLRRNTQRFYRARYQ